MKAFCNHCHRIKEVFGTLKVNGATHHFCMDCHQSEKAAFMRKLEKGDSAATELYQRVSQLLKGKRHDDA